MDDTNFTGRIRDLLSVDAQQTGNIKIVTKRGRRSKQFAEVSQANAALIDALAELAEKLANGGNGPEVKQLIGILRQMLENNQKLQQVVSEALLDIPN